MLWPPIRPLKWDIEIQATLGSSDLAAGYPVAETGVAWYSLPTDQPVVLRRERFPLSQERLESAMSTELQQKAIEAYDQVRVATGRPRVQPPEELLIQVGRFCERLERLPTDDASQVLPLLDGINAEAIELLDPAAVKLQLLLNRLAGATANKELARRLQNTLNRLGFRVACPREGCGAPSLLRWSSALRVKDGTFLFDHLTSDGRLVRHASYARLPAQLTLVSPPPDRRKR